jgi:hypothetical protein
MALFRTSPEKQLTTATGARDKLRARLADAESAVIDLRATAERLALDGAPDDALSAAEAKTRALIDRTATLRAALAQSEADVADLERGLAEQADKAMREKTGSEIELLAREVIEAAAAMTAAAAVFADCAARAAVAVPEARGLEQFTGVCRVEVPAAADLIARLLRTHAAAVLARTAPALLAKPPERFVEPLAAKPPTVQLFCLRPIKFRIASGELIAVQKFRDAEMPLATAKRALELRACVPITDLLRKQHHNTTPGNADPALALDLDAEPATQAPIEPIQRSTPFTIIDRGPGYTMPQKVAR